MASRRMSARTNPDGNTTGKNASVPNGVNGTKRVSKRVAPDNTASSGKTAKTSRRADPVSAPAGDTSSSSGYFPRIVASSITLGLFSAVLYIGAGLVKERMAAIEKTQDPVKVAEKEQRLAEQARRKREQKNARAQTVKTPATDHTGTIPTPNASSEDTDPGYALYIRALDLKKSFRLNDAIKTLEAAESRAEGAGLWRKITAEQKKERTFKDVIDLLAGDVLPHAQKAHDADKNAVFVQFMYRNRPAIGLVEGAYNPDHITVSVIFTDRPALRRELLLPLDKSSGIAFTRVDSEYVIGVFEDAYRRVADKVLPTASTARDYYDLIVLANRLKLDDHLLDLLERAYAKDRRLKSVFMYEMVSRGLDETMMYHFRNEDKKVDQKIAELKALFPHEKKLQKIIRETEDFLMTMRKKRDEGYVSTITIAARAEQPERPELTPAPATPAVPNPDTGSAASPSSSSPPPAGTAKPVSQTVLAREATGDVQEIQVQKISSSGHAVRQDLVDKADTHFEAGLTEYRKWKNNWGDPRAVLQAAAVEFDQAVDAYQQAAEEETNPALKQTLFNRATDANMLLYACHKHQPLNMRDIEDDGGDEKPPEQPKKKFTLGGRKRK